MDHVLSSHAHIMTHPKEEANQIQENDLIHLYLSAEFLIV